MEGIFAEMARRKAMAAEEEKRRFELENARTQEMHEAQLRSMAPQQAQRPQDQWTEVGDAPGPIMSVAPGQRYTVRADSLDAKRGFHTL